MLAASVSRVIGVARTPLDARLIDTRRAVREMRAP